MLLKMKLKDLINAESLETSDQKTPKITDAIDMAIGGIIECLAKLEKRIQNIEKQLKAEFKNETKTN